MAVQYGDMLCQDVDLVGTSSELDNDEEEEDDDEDDDDFYDEEDSNLDDDFEGLSINEEAEIMRYALASSHDLQQYERQRRAEAEQQQHPGDAVNNYDFGQCRSNVPGGSCGGSTANLSIYNSTEKLIMDTSLFDNKMRLIGNGIVLLVTTFALLVLLPLYFQQMGASGPQHNVFGATFLVSAVAALVFLLLAAALGVATKWRVPFYKPPLPWTKLIAISLSYGLACILFATSCYQRVPCHLQDPLKGAALVFSLIFYFFFCRKVMGLQRIFSATTTVVGLFIAVDYGLCDEFRCRGTDLTGQFFQNTLNGTPMEWKAAWAILYIVGIALWSLHVSLLESSIVIPVKEKQRFTPKPTGFLRTVSRIVASAETPQTKDPAPDVECEKQQQQLSEEKEPEGVKCASSFSCPGHHHATKSHPLHIIVWVHVLSVVVVAAFGWIDIFPVGNQEPIKSFDRHLSDTANTLMCHLNVAADFRAGVATEESESSPGSVELLTNFVPGSANFNETVQKLRRRRSRRNVATQTTKLLNSTAQHRPHSLELHFNYTTKHHVNRTPGKHLNHSKFPSGGAPAAAHDPRPSKDEQQRKSENAYTWKWLQGIADNKVNQTLGDALNSLRGATSNSNGGGGNADQSGGSSSGKSSRMEIVGNCGRTQIYGVILLLVYLLFAACLINFLIISESAVFTVCVVTGALPLIGIFWSLFEVSFDDSDQTVGLIWSPEVSGELICSLLGCPIVFLGIGLLCRANFNEQLLQLREELAGGRSQCGGSTLHLSYENRNYYATYLETGLSDVDVVGAADRNAEGGVFREKSGSDCPGATH